MGRSTLFCDSASSSSSSSDSRSYLDVTLEAAPFLPRRNAHGGDAHDRKRDRRTKPMERMKTQTDRDSWRKTKKQGVELRNIHVTYLLQFMWGLSSSIWTQTILSAWIFLLSTTETTKLDTVATISNLTRQTHVPARLLDVEPTARSVDVERRVIDLNLNADIFDGKEAFDVGELAIAVNLSDVSIELVGSVNIDRLEDVERVTLENLTRSPTTREENHTTVVGGDEHATSNGQGNTLVGMFSSIQGVSGLLVAFPAGYYADKYKRSPVIKVGSFSFLLAVLFTAASVLSVSDPMVAGSGLEASEMSRLGLVGLGIGLAFWGIGSSIFSGPLEALFADSIDMVTDGHPIRSTEHSESFSDDTGSHSCSQSDSQAYASPSKNIQETSGPVATSSSSYFMMLQISYHSPSVVGALMTIGLFHIYGNTWSIEHLKTPFLIGVFFAIPVAVLGCFLSDLEDRTGSERSNDIIEANMVNGYKISVGSKGKEWVPYIQFASGLVDHLGSGLTQKFFSLFFISDLNLSPVSVQLVAVLSTSLLIISAYSAQKLSAFYGRVQIVVVSRTFSISCLVFMILLSQHRSSTPPISLLETKSTSMLWRISGSTSLTLLLYLAHAATMHCTYALDVSILMDYVPKHERSRWKALDAVIHFTAAAAPFLGGILADASGYLFAFTVTVVIRAVAIGIYSTLFRIVKK